MRARLNAVVDDRVGDGIVELIEREALAADVLGPADIERIRRDMLEAEARRLQPHYVRSWFAAAFELTGGRMLERETGRFEIVRVPGHVRERGRILPGRVPVLSRYERATFDKGRARVEGKPPAELIAPGHPLLEAVLDLTLERDGGVLRQGALLVDEEPAAEPRILLYLEHAITDARATPAGNHVVSRRFEFMEVLADGTARPAGPAPYLDLRPPLDTERGAAADLLAGWPLARADVERVGLEHAVGVAVPEHLAEVRAKVVARVAKVRAAVHERLSKEIEYWDHRANVLSEQAAAGKQPRMNPDRARARANDLAARLEARMGELDREQQLQALPPLVVGAALVLPVASVASSVDGVGPPLHARNTKEVELRAVDAVVAAEEALGREVEVMPPNNPGFDLRSTAEDGRVWFLEVKGRLSGAATFTVTRNEILHALNIPDAYLLALVEVSPDGAASDSLRYLRRPFGDAVSLPFATTSANLDWDEY